MPEMETTKDGWEDLREVNRERNKLESIPEDKRSPEQQARIKELARLYISYMGGVS